MCYGLMTQRENFWDMILKDMFCAKPKALITQTIPYPWGSMVVGA